MDIDYNKLDWDTIGKYNRNLHPETTVERAQLHIKNKNFHQAILDLEFYIKTNPSTAIGYLLLGQCHRFSNNLVSAIQNFEKGLLIAQDSVSKEFLFDYASCLWFLDKNSDALNIANKILNQDNSDISGLLIKSQILHSLKEYEQAFYYSTKLLEIQPQLWQAWITRFHINYDLEDFKRAISDFNQAVLINSDLPAHEHTIYGSSLLQAGLKKEALKEFEQALKLGDSKAKGFIDALTNV